MCAQYEQQIDSEMQLKSTVNQSVTTSSKQDQNGLAKLSNGIEILPTSPTSYEKHKTPLQATATTPTAATMPTVATMPGKC